MVGVAWINVVTNILVSLIYRSNSTPRLRLYMSRAPKHTIGHSKIIIVHNKLIS
jgi:hypothetical protein